MLIITGTQRSGTSVLAKMFMEEGYNLGTTWWDDEVNGGLENPTIAGFYRYYLNDPDFPFQGFEFKKHRGQIGSTSMIKFISLHLRYEVVKFSYLCMNPVFVYIWNRFRGPSLGDKFLVLDRMKGQVWSSKRAHRDVFAADSRLLDQTPHELSGNFYHSIRVLKYLGFSVRVLLFEGLWQEPTHLNLALQDLGVDCQISEETWYSTVDKSKIHFPKEV